MSACAGSPNGEPAGLISFAVLEFRNVVFGRQAESGSLRTGLAAEEECIMLLAPAWGFHGEQRHLLKGPKKEQLPRGRFDFFSPSGPTKCRGIDPWHGQWKLPDWRANRHVLQV